MTPHLQTAYRGRARIALCALLALASSAAFGENQPNNPAASAGDQVVELDKLVVSGMRSSLTKAIEIKREAIGEVDAIVAEDIGKFPANNLIESLQRLPGIQVTGRGAGEISTVSIRGLNDINTTLNGQNIFTASGQSVALQDIAPSLISRVEVYKTRTADLIENGIAGSMNIEMHRPFDFPGRKVILSARGSYADQADRYGSNLSALFSDVWTTSAGKVGAMVNVSSIVIPYRDQRAVAGAQVPFVTATPPAGLVPYQRIFPTMGGVAEDPIWIAGLEQGLPTAPGSTLKINGANVPYVLSRDAVFQNDFTGTRRRPSGNLTLQWAPDNTSEYTFETFYGGYRERSFNSLLFSFVDWWGGPLGAVTLYPNTNIVQSRALVSFPYLFTSGDLTDSKTDSYFYSLSGKWQLSDALSLKSALTYQDSVFKQSFFAVRADRVAPSVSVNFNPGNGIVHFTFPDDQSDPKLWNLAQMYDNGLKNKGDAKTWTADATYASKWDFLKKLKFGVRYDVRKASEAQRTQDAGALGVPLSNYPELVHITRDFFNNGEAGPAAWAVPDGHVLFANADKYRALWKAKFPTFKLSNEQSLFENFHVEEENRAGYGMAEFGTADGKLKGNIGARFVSVKTDINFTDQTTLKSNSASVTKSKLLPSGAVRYEIAPNIFARATYSQTLRRPNFGDLNPAINYVRDVTNIGYGTATGGNPNLKPTQSKNYDLSLEYYFAKSSNVYVTGFRRDIDGLVVGFRRRVTAIVPPATTPYDYILSQPDNASNGRLQGLEFGFTYFPEGLPGILQGLGVHTSYTYLDSKQDIPVTNSTGQVTDVLTRGFFQVSRNSYNATLLYEHKQFSASLAYNWRQAFLNDYEAALFANPLPRYHNPERSLDLQLSYRLLANLELTFSATNLTNETFQEYYGQNGAVTNNFGSNIYSRYYELGARYSF